MALQMEDRFPIIDILDQTPAIPDNCQWAMFLRNHDELTLEMVTDEERDYMWRVYATDPSARINLGIRRRLAPLLANSRRKIELLNTMLFSMPGTPVIYYGDEIGIGDNIYLGDRNGVRTPMQWSPDRNAGFSKANPQRLLLPVIIDPEYHYEAINVENQQKNLSSLLWWMRRVIAMRKNFKAFSRGTLEFLYPDNAKVLAFLRKAENETVLVVVNLSRFAQPAELDLSAYASFVPIEMFSRNRFPTIRKSGYTLTLGPHTCYWFALQPKAEHAKPTKKRIIPTLTVAPDLESLLSEGERADFERRILPAYLPGCRWFGAKARTLREIKIIECPTLTGNGSTAQLWFVEVSYIDGPTETYALPVAIASGEAARRISQTASHAVIARFEDGSVLHDAIWDAGFRSQLFETIANGQHRKGKNGELVGMPGKALTGDSLTTVTNSEVLGVEQSNSSIIFDNKYFLKLYRKLEDGINPDVEVTRFLTDRANFPHVPAFGGAIEYRRGKAEPTVVCLLQNAVTSESDAWTITLDHVGRFYDRVLARKADLQNEPTSIGPLLTELVGGIYPAKTKLLGQRTGELHIALASAQDDRGFAPEPFNAMAQRSVFQSMRALLRRTTALLAKKIDDLPEKFQTEARNVLSEEKVILEREKRILDRRSVAAKIRVHGDYHLGQVLYTGKDFIILDFEGEPARPLSERKLKRSALRDVAGMMRSFQYAAYSALWQPAMRPEDVPFLERWADVWYREMSSVFLQSYLQTTAGAVFVPQKSEDLQILLEAYLLDKAVYEIGYELNNRPDWVVIPIRGIKHILQAS
ncbi:MAG TPA: putative maltokinase, partial [Chthoniobacterales bacterium]|jgi:maltose alpha-D-glucosyltransferase/alpha-amylase